MVIGSAHAIDPSPDDLEKFEKPLEIGIIAIRRRLFRPTRCFVDISGDQLTNYGDYFARVRSGDNRFRVK